jgi:hypothetical protein
VLNNDNLEIHKEVCKIASFFVGQIRKHGGGNLFLIFNFKFLQVPSAEMEDLIG